MSEKVQGKIIVVGIGPGSFDYILPVAKKCIEEANVVVGGSRALQTFARDDQEQMTIQANIDAVLAFIREKMRAEDVVVMVSGDPGYYSMLDALRRTFPTESITVIPGISSMQLAFSRVALPWHEARLLSFHGRVPKEEMLRYEKGAICGMLTDGKHNSHTIARAFLNHGWPKKTRLYILSRLSYEDERVIATTLDGAERIEKIGHGILIIEDRTNESGE